MSSGSIYENKVRIRSCGILIENNAVLLLRLFSPVSRELVWTPPGGGVEFGETLSETLIREFREETGLEVSCGPLLHINELVKPPFHAVEHFYEVYKTGGMLETGTDPEHDDDKQVIKDARFVPLEEVSRLSVKPETLLKFLSRV